MIEILNLILIGLVIFFIWRNGKKELKDRESLSTELQQTVSASLTQGITSLSQTQGKIEQNLKNSYSETIQAVQNITNSVIEVKDILSNPTSAGQFGNWQLELFLEKSNLSPEHYRLEKSHYQGRPDAEVDLPGNGKIFIDAKAILQSWIENFEQSDEQTKETLLEENTQNIIKTATDLSLRGYNEIDVPQTGIILMFLPLDSLFIDFMERVDKDKLIEASKGFKKSGSRGSPIVFVSPSTIGGFLGMVGLLWRERNLYEDQSALLIQIKNFAKNLQNTAQHLIKGSHYHLRAGDSFRKSFLSLSKTSSLVDDLGKLTDTDELDESLKSESFGKVNRISGLTKNDVEKWLIENPELAKEISSKENNE